MVNSEADKDQEDYTIPDEEELPFACFICREDFKSPVITVCGHYFCGPCAIEDNKKNPKCRVCGKKTFGVFNKAVKLIKKLVASGKLASGSGIGSGGKVSAVASVTRQGSWETVQPS